MKLSNTLAEMESKLSRQFVEDHTSVLDMVPFTWNVRAEGPYSALDLKMCRLKGLNFEFEFGSEPRDQWPVTGHPERILKLDVSLNELETLGRETLSPFENLCELDASLNSLKSVEGVTHLPHLLVLQLSFNTVSTLRSLKTCNTLTTLNVSYNQLLSIRAMPVLGNLTQLYIGHNKLNSLEGIQNLSQLRELHAHSNQITDLLPLSSSLHLLLLDLSHNQLSSLSHAVEVLRGLHRLRQVLLKGNPIAGEGRYITMVTQGTSVEVLDSTPLRRAWNPRLRVRWLGGVQAAVGQTKQDLEKAARMAYQDRVQSKRQETQRAIHYLHGRIRDLQEDMREQEDLLSLELQGCLRYLDTIPPEDFTSVDPQKISAAMDQHKFTRFWERWYHGQRKPGMVRSVDPTKPEEVVQAVVKLLENYLPCPPASDDTCPQH